MLTVRQAGLDINGSKHDLVQEGQNCVCYEYSLKHLNFTYIVMSINYCDD